MHVAEKGQGPEILFLYGFPELRYSRCHQTNALASLSYRAVAPDLRGFGDTDELLEMTSYTCFHVIGDLIGLIDLVAPNDEKVFVVGHDSGTYMACFLCLFRANRIKALVNLSVVFNPNTSVSNSNWIKALGAYYGDDYYIGGIQEPGEIEAQFEQISKGYGHPPDAIIALPGWLSDEDIKYFTTKFDKNALLKESTITKGVKEYIHKGEFRSDVPLLEEVTIMEGVGHFINQEKGHQLETEIGTSPGEKKKELEKS
ncbi:hypothetical protein CUMW_018920 [Citrus unshiu]|nr:hypothetical protein CUMW_018920 [Citrus unshiu]